MKKVRSTSWQSINLAAALIVTLAVIGAAQSRSQTGQLATSPKTASHSFHDASSRPSEMENLDDITLATSGLQKVSPFVGQKDAEADFTRELVQVKWRSADPIDLYVIRPKGVVKPEVTLFLYSYPSETDRFRNNDYCKRVTSGGFAAVGFVSALTGHRYHMRPMKEWFVSELKESLSKSTHDVQMVMNYLSTRDDLSTKQFAMFGEGSGATIAILAAAADERIRTLDLLDPWGDWPDWLAASTLIPDTERPNLVKPAFVAGVANLDPVVYLPKLNDRHIRIQFVTEDSITPAEAQKRISAAAPESAQVLHYESAAQLFSSVSGGRLFEWIKDQYRADRRLTGAATQQMSQEHGDSIVTK